jgi:formate hydrogenlyase subunit 4
LSHLAVEILTGLIALIGATILGGFIYGLDRKISAHMQGRKGPPLLQPYYDVIKLFGKERFVVNRMQDIYAVGFLLFTAAAVVMFFTGQDLLMLIFVLAFGNISLIMGAMSVRSPYSRIGAQREIIQLMAAEPVIILTAVGLYLVKGSFMISSVLTASFPLIAYMPLQFIALLMVLTIKLRKSPFDFSTSHHGHQELIKGLTMEFSGFQLAVIEIGEWLEMVLLLGFVGLFWATPIYAGIILAALAFLLELLIDNISARTTWIWMLKVVGIIGLGLSVTNMIWLFIR